MSGRAALCVLPGAMFGAGLAISGMTDPAKVVGFLDVTRAWDPSLAMVMAGGVTSFAVLNWLIHRRCAAPRCGGELPGARGCDRVDARLVIGAAVFGVGWALGGVCPGPGLVNLSRGRLDTLLFVLGMLAGMLLAQRLFAADAAGDGVASAEGAAG